MKLVTQSATLLGSFLFVLIVVATPLSSYMMPILGGIIALSVVFMMLVRRAKSVDDLFIGSNQEVATITIAVMLAVFATGGLESNLFFILYTLLFGIIFLFEPATVFIMLLGMLTVFYGQTSSGGLEVGIIKLGSLVLFSPIAYFFGKEFAKRHQNEAEIEDKTGQIIEDATTLRTNSNLSEEEIEQLDDIIEKTYQLRMKVQEDN